MRRYEDVGSSYKDCQMRIAVLCWASSIGLKDSSLHASACFLQLFIHSFLHPTIYTWTSAHKQLSRDIWLGPWLVLFLYCRLNGPAF